MEGKEWVLVNKPDEDLYLKLTHNKVGKSKGQGRAGWEWTEHLDQAATFNNLADIDQRIRLHKVPPGGVMVRTYIHAHTKHLAKIIL